MIHAKYSWIVYRKTWINIFLPAQTYGSSCGSSLNSGIRWNGQPNARDNSPKKNCRKSKTPRVWMVDEFPQPYTVQHIAHQGVCFQTSVFASPNSLRLTFSSFGCFMGYRSSLYSVPRSCDGRMDVSRVSRTKVPTRTDRIVLALKEVSVGHQLEEDQETVHQKPQNQKASASKTH